jgi:hypothetical protein
VTVLELIGAVEAASYSATVSRGPGSRFAGGHPDRIGVTGARPTGRVPGMKLFARRYAEIAKGIDIGFRAEYGVDPYRGGMILTGPLNSRNTVHFLAHTSSGLRNGAPVAGDGVTHQRVYLPPVHKVTKGWLRVVSSPGAPAIRA